MSKCIGTIIIGLGRIGLKYQIKKKSIKTHCKSIFLNKNFKLIAGVDINKSNRNIFEKEYKSPSFSNVREALKIYLPKFVIISTPTNLHKKNFEEVIKFKSVKYILIEKPISFNYQDSKYIIETCKKKKIKLFINYIRRSNSGLVNLKKILNKVNNNHVEIYYNNGFINNGSHYLNLMRFYFNKPLKIEVVSFVKRSKYDFNVNLQIVFKKAIVNIVYKNNFIYDMIFKSKLINLKNKKKKRF